ncbi:MAG: mucoidy inhibitor MuiA family protein [Melioribacteraceae bacterium]|nr:mucoidy inhibitor MuiA family protein [Melioribacteraceae bacterium]
MKTTKLLFLIILTASITFASNEVRLSSNLDQVTVFTNGAEISRTLNTTVVQGISDLIISNLENNIDNNSLQVSIKGNVTILSINQRTNYLKNSEKPERIIQLEKNLETLKDKVFYLQTEKEVIEAEIDMILSNKVLGSGQQGVKVAELKKMSEYYNDRLLKIKINHKDKTKKINEFNEEINNLQKQINELTGKFNQPVNEVVVQVTAKENVKVSVKLGYVIYDAGWSPAYDLRVADINSSIELYYKANVWQNSGIDWNDINVKLSTRNPRENNNKPVINPWYLNFVQPMPIQNLRQKFGRMEKSVSMDAAAPMMESESLANYMAIEENQLSVEFVPSIKVTIPSDGKQHNIALEEKELDARFEYYTAPKLREAAYLIGYIKDFKSANLIPGNANIYFEGSYVGKVFLNPRSFEKEFPISLGKDDNIFVKRKQITDFSETKFLSSNIERRFSYEIEIRNNKKDMIDIIVEDNLPISQHEDIEVELIEKSGADYDNNTGLLTWKISLEPNKTNTKNLIYTVKYPQDKRINNL